MRYYESPSSCSTYDSCALKYKFKYIDQLPDPSGPAAALGTEFHEAVYLSFATKSMQHDNPTIKAMLAAFYANNEITSLGSIAAIEKRVEVQCGKGNIKGFIDLIFEDGSIADIKTSSSLFTPEKIKAQKQHLFYVYSALKLGILKADSFPYIFRYLVVTTKKSPLTQVVTFKVSKEALQEFETDFNIRLNKIALNVETKIFPHTRGPHCYYCSFKSICPAHNDR